MLGVLIVVVSLPLAFLVKEPPSSDGSSREIWDQRSAESAFKTTVRSYLLTVGSMCSIAAVSGTQQNLKLFLSLDRHYTQSDAARVLSLVLAFSIAGRLLMGWLADRFSKKVRHAADLPAGRSGHSTCCSSGRTQLAIYASAAVFGIGLGGDYMIIPLMTAEIFGVQILGRLMGVILTAGGIAEAAVAVVDGPLARHDRELFRKLCRPGRHRLAGRGAPCWHCPNRRKPHEHSSHSARGHA